MKLFKGITSAAVIGASLIIAKPAEASIWYDMKNEKMILLNDGRVDLIFTDGNSVSYFETGKPETGYPIDSGLHEGINSEGHQYRVFGMKVGDRKKFLASQLYNIRQGRQLPPKYSFSYLSITR